MAVLRFTLLNGLSWVDNAHRRRQWFQKFGSSANLCQKSRTKTKRTKQEGLKPYPCHWGVKVKVVSKAMSRVYGWES